MIIRRQLYSPNKVPMKKVQDSGMEFKPIYKKVAQPSSANGNGAARDVEDLLQPIQHQKYNEDLNSSQNSKERTERNLWRNDEVMEMLYTMQEIKALERLNDKTVKSENIFKDVEVIMHRNGFVKKSHVQIWTKWKFLKSTYMTSRRNGVIPRMVPPQIYETIHRMITSHNQSMTDSCSSVDGDNNSINGMVISGVEGGVAESSDVANGAEDDSFGMAHPIFGFRLGMVKSEPEDTGYEAVANNDSDKDPLEEDNSPSKLDTHVKEENREIPVKTTKESTPVQKTLEIPHRGRGRPPKNPPTSTPINTPSPPQKPAQMPPLRVAPFAKTINTSNAMAVNRPPPPLTMPPTPRIRVANLTNLKNDDPSRFTQPKLIPKPALQSQPVHPVRLQKEVTTNTRSSSTPSPSYPKMKQIPMRKTPYSLRPDRAIPDLDASLSPPPPSIEKPSNKRIEEVANTRQLVMQSNPNNLTNNNIRKRRSDIPDPLIAKQPRLSNNMEDGRNSPRTYNTNNSREAKQYGKVLQNVIVDLSSSLRKMQTQMMQEFFKKQNELLEREHRFQMQQDNMLMKAFHEQTQEIMLSVKQLVGTIKNSKDEQTEEKDEMEREVKVNSKSSRIQQNKRQQTEPEDEMEEHHIQSNEIDEGEVEMENDMEEEEEQDQEQEMEDMYADGEEQQEQMEEHEDNEEQDLEEEMENNADEGTEEDDMVEENEQAADEDQSQTTEDHQENGLTAEEKDNSNDSVDDEQNPLN